jgi:hypothetical protein
LLIALCGLVQSIPGSNVSSGAGIALGHITNSSNISPLTNELENISSLSFTWIRFDFNWSIIQPQDDTNYWKQYDEAVSLAAQYHLKVLGAIDYALVWAAQAGSNAMKGCATAGTCSVCCICSCCSSIL